ncbi:cadherin-24-like [Eriocheir sinensis]|uniref:cadherin-24-like n=1 Tax=Eriocheir sinensis TaxID=95602 RepID=UPI0021C63E1D|nr:cadherin-24-like [Eriocheir sinensis]
MAGMAVAEETGLTYRLNDTVNFDIDSTGVIYTLRPLDHEGSNGHYSLQVTATEQGGRPRHSALVSLQVTDAPEPPRFDSKHYQFTVSEFAREGGYVGTVRARDDDGDLERYFLHGAEKKTFSIDADSGVITLKKPPTGARWEFHLQVEATDLEGHVAIVPVSVFVLTSNPSSARLVAVAQDDQLGRGESHSKRVSCVDDVVNQQLCSGLAARVVCYTVADGGSVARMAGRCDPHPQGLHSLGGVDLKV